MPKPANKAEAPEVEVIASEKPPVKQAEEIEVDAVTGQPVSREPQIPSLSAEDLKKTEARWQYELRQVEKRILDSIRGAIQPAVPTPAEKVETPEDFDPKKDAVAKTNYQRYTRMEAEEIADKKFDIKIKAWQEEQTRLNEQNALRQHYSNQLEREKAWVLEKAPSLNDETSDEFKAYYATYNRMLAEDPTLVTNPRAPRLVWYEMRESVQDRDKTPASLEAERLRRVAAGSSPQGRISTPLKTIKLTQEELDLCKERNLSPAIFAQAKETNLKEGLSA